jgi:hypothetical protein
VWVGVDRLSVLRTCRVRDRVSSFATPEVIENMAFRKRHVLLSPASELELPQALKRPTCHSDSSDSLRVRPLAVSMSGWSWEFDLTGRDLQKWPHRSVAERSLSLCVVRLTRTGREKDCLDSITRSGGSGFVNSGSAFALAGCPKWARNSVFRVVPPTQSWEIVDAYTPNR